MNEIGLVVSGWTIYPSELRRKGLVGRIMWDIAFCDPDGCRDKEAHLELLEATAKEIVQRIKGGDATRSISYQDKMPVVQAGSMGADSEFEQQ